LSTLQICNYCISVFFFFLNSIFPQEWPLNITDLDYTNSQDGFTSAYGPRAYRGYDFHPALDIGAPAGIPVIAMYSCTVVHLGSLGQSDENVGVYKESKERKEVERIAHRLS